MNPFHAGWGRRCMLAAMPALCLVTTPLTTSAQAYPAKPITLVVPFAAGGGTDSIARDIAKTMSEKLGQAVVVDNRGGGGGAIGANLVAKARADGYTLLFATSTFATNAAAEPNLPYQAGRDFAPVAMIGRGPLLLVASPQLGAKSLADVQRVAGTRTEGLNYCSAGIGSINHLSGEMFRQKSALALTHVAYKGSGPATLDLLAGRIDLFFATVPTILPHVREGKVPVLAVTSARRSRLFPDVPTMAEAGILGFDITTWWGVLAPAGTPQAIVDTLNRVINESAAQEPIKGRLVHEGADPMRLSPAEFQRELDRELALWREVVRGSNMQLK